ncbi:MAG: hypothetical protein HY854_04000 [Burkholderiales bacterium]|nr:hypothetical protein [Burkholderiales bacterium]
MKLHNAFTRFGLVVALSQAAAIAQVANSPLGTWRSNALVSPDWPIAATVQLTVTTAEGSAVKGRYQIFFPVSGGLCPTGPVSGSFDGVALKVSSTPTNVCPERVFDLKFSGASLVGTYRGQNGQPNEVTFTRQ